MSISIRPISAHLNKDTDLIGKMVTLLLSRIPTWSVSSARKRSPLRRARASTPLGLRPSTSMAVPTSSSSRCGTRTALVPMTFWAGLPST